MNTQEMFDKVVNHMRSQGNGGGNFCQRGWAYVNPNNPCERCAKGILMQIRCINNQYITDGGYLDTNPVYHIGRELTDNETRMLNALEFVFEHFNTDEWEEHFENIARVCSVTLSPLNTIKLFQEEKINV